MAPHPVPVGPVTPFSASVSPMSWRRSVTDILDLDLPIVRRRQSPTLLRLMLDLGRYTLGVIVSSAGILFEVRRGRRKWILALGTA